MNKSALFAGACLLAVASQQQFFLLKHHTFGPSARDHITIEEGTTYTVPPGRRLVITGVAQKFENLGEQNVIEVHLNGTNFVSGNCSNSVGRAVRFPIGAVAQSGDVVTVGAVPSSADIGVVFGYLE